MFNIFKYNTPKNTIKNDIPNSTFSTKNSNNNLSTNQLTKNINNKNNNSITKSNNKNELIIFNNTFQQIQPSITEKNKFHYFIGSKINEQLYNTLNKTQRYIKTNKFKLNNVFPINENDNTYVLKYIYLGYLDELTMNKYLEYLNPLLLSISNKFKPIECKGVQISVRNKEYVSKKISLKLKDEPMYLTDVIIPFLKKYGYETIMGQTKTTGGLNLDLLYFESSDLSIKELNQKLETVYLPKDDIIVDNLCLIKGTPYIRKQGRLSKDDKMFFEINNKYYFPLIGNL